MSASPFYDPVYGALFPGSRVSMNTGPGAVPTVGLPTLGNAYTYDIAQQTAPNGPNGQTISSNRFVWGDDPLAMKRPGSASEWGYASTLFQKVQGPPPNPYSFSTMEQIRNGSLEWNQAFGAQLGWQAETYADYGIIPATPQRGDWQSANPKPSLLPKPGNFVPYKANMGGEVFMRTREEKATGYDMYNPIGYQDYIAGRINDQQLYSSSTRMMLLNDDKAQLTGTAISMMPALNGGWYSNYGGLFSLYRR